MSTTLRGLLGLHAPFLPFITDELWEHLYGDLEPELSLHATRWPEPTGTTSDAEATALIRGVLHACRAERAAQHLSQSAEIAALTIANADTTAQILIESHRQSLLAASRAASIVSHPRLSEGRDIGWRGIITTIRQE